MAVHGNKQSEISKKNTKGPGTLKNQRARFLEISRNLAL
jgi:hypothetical protein